MLKSSIHWGKISVKTERKWFFMEEKVNYRELAAQLRSLTEGVPYETANLANASALLFENLPEINWAGFYQVMEDALVLGPFQGKPACIRIPMGRGVCGTAAKQDTPQVVYNVHQFPGHIACDSASLSEIVIPSHSGNRLWGVLDIDSPRQGRFTPEDLAGLKLFVEELENIL